jgi:hypothetical protein
MLIRDLNATDEKETISSITTQTFLFPLNATLSSSHPRLGAYMYTAACNSSTGEQKLEKKTCCIPDWALAYETQGYF